MPLASTSQGAMEPRFAHFLSDLQPYGRRQVTWETWKDLQDQLEGYGISPKASESNRQYIMASIEATRSVGPSHEQSQRQRQEQTPQTLLDRNDHHEMTNWKYPNTHTDSDVASSLAASTLTATDAQSTIESEAPLLSNECRRNSHTAWSQMTTGRKAFVGLCHVVDLVVPVDVNEEKMSMRSGSERTSSVDGVF